MGGIVRPVNLLYECSFIIAEFFFYMHYCNDMIIILKKDLVSFFYFVVVCVKYYRKSPWKIVREALLIKYALIIFTNVETFKRAESVSYTHLRAHETRHDLVC